MVNEERLSHMIKMAEFDTANGKKCMPMIQYTRKDYVAMQLLKSFVAGTIAYGVIMGLWALCSMEELFHTINSMDLKDFLISMLLKYIIFLVAYLAVTYVVYHHKYTVGRKKVKQYYASLKRVEQMYEREERLKMPQERQKK